MEFTDIAADFKSLTIRHWHRVWEPFMRKYQCDYVCELGVHKGENFHNMIAHSPKLAVAVDAWVNDGTPSHNDGGYTQEELNNQYAYFQTQVNYLPFVRIIRDYTDKTAPLFPNDYFDFVYFDADHSVAGCHADLINWYPKIKPGKFLVGHDYRRGFGVVEAVNKFITQTKLELIFMPPSTWAVVKK